MRSKESEPVKWCRCPYCKLAMDDAPELGTGWYKCPNKDCGATYYAKVNKIVEGEL